MDRVEGHNDGEHVIDITSSSEAFPSRSIVDRPTNQSNSSQNEDPPSTSATNSPANVGFSRSTASANHDQRSPLNSGYWVCTELVIIMSQITAAIVVLSFSRHEHPNAPLFTWVIGYASGCVATLPLLFRRFHNCNQLSNQDLAQSGQSSAPSSMSATRFLTAVLVSARCHLYALPIHITEFQTYHQKCMDCTSWFIAYSLVYQVRTPLGQMYRFKVFIEYLKMGLDCFFAVWFVVGNIWIFGSSFSDAPNLYRLCIVFLTLSCIGYAMPFILCATVCFCLPCIISIMGFREEQTHIRGATIESINSLPTYKFKVKKNKHTNYKNADFNASEDGVVAAGTENEHTISGEDAVSRIFY